MGYFKSWYEKNIADIDPQKESREIWDLAEEIKEDFNDRHPDAIYKYCADLELQKRKLEKDMLPKIKLILQNDIKVEKEINAVKKLYRDFLRDLINDSMKEEDNE